MKLIFLLTVAFAFRWFTPPKNAPIAADVLDGLLKTGAKDAVGVANPQIIIHQLDNGAASVAVRSAENLGGRSFKKGTVQVVGLDGKKAHLLPLERVQRDGAGIQRIQRQFGLAAPKMTMMEATALGVGSTAVLGGVGVGADRIAKGRRIRRRNDEIAFMIANGATPENSSI